jgi:signal peptidase I
MNWKFWNKEAASTARAKPKSKIREWWDAILFAVIAATLIRWLIMEAYTIPTPSMENSLLVGDFLFVSKFHYGTRTTTTPLQIPLTHQKIWFTNLPSYSDAIKLPQYRLPGFTKVQREDVVVFNVPPRGLNDNIDYPVDLKTNYIKRCVGIAGDSIMIRDKQVHANGAPINNPPDMQFSYNVVSSSAISERNFEKLGIGPEDIETGSHQQDGTVYYEMWLTKGKADEMKALPYIKSIAEKPDDPVNDARGILPYNPQYFVGDHFRDTTRLTRWTANNFGPLWIPKEGATIEINKLNLALYGTTIALYDHNENVKIEGDKLIIDGQEVKQYTFKQNYYFMMGDNRHNSLDSRYWGFVPEDHVVGKAFFIWLSLDKNAGALSKVRWSRFFKLIE